MLIFYFFHLFLTVVLSWKHELLEMWRREHFLLPRWLRSHVDIWWTVARDPNFPKCTGEFGEELPGQNCHRAPIRNNLLARLISIHLYGLYYRYIASTIFSRKQVAVLHALINWKCFSHFSYLHWFYFQGFSHILWLLCVWFPIDVCNTESQVWASSWCCQKNK